MQYKSRRTLTTALLVFALAVTLLGPVVAFAGDSGACYSIQDADARAYCLARAKREPSLCYNVQRSDLRSMCLAEVRR